MQEAKSVFILYQEKQNRKESNSDLLLLFYLHEFIHLFLRMS